MSYRDLQSAPRRSRSPTDRDRSYHKRHRSPHTHHHHTSSKRPKPPASPLPFHASPLSKDHYTHYRPMFGLYLDIQKQKVLEELPEDEAKGRWKSFMGKWNCGELAGGWYDPATLQKAQASAASYDHHLERSEPRGSPIYGSPKVAESSDEDLVGPALPGQEVAAYNKGKRRGPAVPDTQDLELRRELQHEDSLAERQDLRYKRKLDRNEQKQRLDELVPHAEAGSKDRMLEKKRERADGNRAFASAKIEAGVVEEVPESDLLGDEDGSIEGFKKQKKEMDRKKNEREVRREEILRARMEEREERIRVYKAKEEKTMSGLVALAKARFG